MTKRIAERDLPSPAKGLKLSLERCSSRHGALNGTGEILDFKVEMDQRPVSTVVAN